MASFNCTASCRSVHQPTSGVHRAHGLPQPKFASSTFQLKEPLTSLPSFPPFPSSSPPPPGPVYYPLQPWKSSIRLPRSPTELQTLQLLLSIPDLNIIVPSHPEGWEQTPNPLWASSAKLGGKEKKKKKSTPILNIKSKKAKPIQKREKPAGGNIEGHRDYLKVTVQLLSLFFLKDQPLPLSLSSSFHSRFSPPLCLSIPIPHPTSIFRPDLVCSVGSAAARPANQRSCPERCTEEGTSALPSTHLLYIHQEPYPCLLPPPVPLRLHAAAFDRHFYQSVTICFAPAGQFHATSIVRWWRWWVVGGGGSVVVEPQPVACCVI